MALGAILVDNGGKSKGVEELCVGSKTFLATL